MADEVSRNERMFWRRWVFHHVGHPVKDVKELWHCWQNLRAYEVRHNQAVARVRLLATELALGCYHSSQGQPPSQLEELVPKYLRRVPVDPFSGQPLVYSPKGTNWTLYSVGPGGRKKGVGVPSAGGRLFYDFH